MIGRPAWLRLFLCFALLSLALTSGSAFAQNGGELRFCLRSEPKTFDPLLVDDDASLSIQPKFGGVTVDEMQEIALKGLPNTQRGTSEIVGIDTDVSQFLRMTLGLWKEIDIRSNSQAKLDFRMRNGGIPQRQTWNG